MFYHQEDAGGRVAEGGWVSGLLYAAGEVRDLVLRLAPVVFGGVEGTAPVAGFGVFLRPTRGWHGGRGGCVGRS